MKPDLSPESSKTCPECGAILGASVVICVSCGYNLSTGQKMITQTDADLPSDDSEILAKIKLPELEDSSLDHSMKKILYTGGVFLLLIIVIIILFTVLNMLKSVKGDNSSLPKTIYQKNK